MKLDVVEYLKHGVLVGAPIGLLWTAVWQPAVLGGAAALGLVLTPLVGAGAFGVLQGLLGVASLSLAVGITVMTVLASVLLSVVQDTMKTKMIPKYFQYVAALLGTIVVFPAVPIALVLTWVYKKFNVI